jgi:antitoxin component of MazEF toxin-antitoxin module
MCYRSVIQEIRRKDGGRQLYVTVPAEMAQGLGLQAGQSVQWLTSAHACVTDPEPAETRRSAARADKKGARYC